jgi:hypothetical protein
MNERSRAEAEARGAAALGCRAGTLPAQASAARQRFGLRPSAAQGPDEADLGVPKLIRRHSKVNIVELLNRLKLHYVFAHNYISVADLKGIYVSTARPLLRNS